MSSSISIPPPGFVPRPQPPPDELMTGAPVDRGLLGENRRRLDSRRLGAFVLDLLILIVVVVPLRLHYGPDLGAAVFGSALVLTYHFLFEIACGQTIGKRAVGLRVVMADGSPVTVRAASARAVLRSLDCTGAGLIVYVLSGGRRRRIGDYAAGTIVCDVARVGTFNRPLVARDATYPAVWVAIGLALLVLTTGGHTPWSYRAGADRTCASATAFLASHGSTAPVEVQAVHAQLEMALASMDPPPNWRDRHRQLLSRLHTENLAMLTQGAVAPAVSADARATMRQLGYRDCASVL
jgi:uncharacterized RDD family membrane protein YckC